MRSEEWTDADVTFAVSNRHTHHSHVHSHTHTHANSTSLIVAA